MKKLISISVFLLLSIVGFCATRTVSAAGGNFNSVGTWDEGIIPVVGDDIVCRGDGTSGNLTVAADGPGGAATGLNSVDFTFYTATLTINSGITLYVAGNWTSGAGMTITGSGTVIILATSNITSNGVTFDCNLNVKPAAVMTCTVTGNLTVSGTKLLSVGNGANVPTFSGSNIYTGSFYITSFFTASQTIEVNGVAGTLGSSSTTVYSNYNLIINSAGTITFGANFVFGNSVATNTLTLTSGNIVTTGNTASFNYTFSVVGFSSVVWNNLSITNPPSTLTLASDFIINGVFSTAVGNIRSIVGATIYLTGSAKTHTIGINNLTIQNIVVQNSMVFAGSFGMTITNFTCATPGAIIQFTAGKTYTISTSLLITGTLGSHIIFQSTTASFAYVTLSPASTQTIAYLDGTWIDSSGGNFVNTPDGVLSNVINWGSLIGGDPIFID